MRRHFLIVSTLLIVTLQCCGCPPAGSTGGVAPPAAPAVGAACPPLGSDYSVSVSGTADSITVFANSTLEYEGNGYWCDTSELGIQTLPIASIPGNLPKNALAAVDVDPDNIKWLSGDKPQLAYDLVAHPSQLHPESCSNSQCYAIYQLIGNYWKYVGPAVPDQQSGMWRAVGRINHLSVFALVELDNPQQIAQDSPMTMFIASEFVFDDTGGMSVGVTYDYGFGFDPLSEQWILRFQGVDMSGGENIPPECSGLESVIEAFFTCVFPIESPVEFVNGSDSFASLRNQVSGAYQPFYTSSVEQY